MSVAEKNEEKSIPRLFHSAYFNTRAGNKWIFSLEYHAEGSFLNSSGSIGLSLEILNIQWKREEVGGKSLKRPILFSNLLEWHFRISTMDKVAVQTQIDEEE